MISKLAGLAALGLVSGLPTPQQSDGPASYLGVVYPSPGADPLYITAQGQQYTTYSPEYTLCPTTTAAGNVSAACSTGYAASPTAACFSTIVVPGTLPYIVSECDQTLTFSTELNTEYNTYFAAPWQDVATGIPNNTVTAAVCPVATGACSTYLEVWSSTDVEAFPTETSTADFTATITGPGVANIVPSSTVTLTDSAPTTVTVLTTYTVDATTSQASIAVSTLTAAASSGAAQTTVAPQTNCTSKKVRRAVDDDGNTVPQNNVPSSDSDDSPNAGKVGGQFAPVDDDGNVVPQNNVPSDDSNSNAGKVGGQFAPLPVDNSTDASTASDDSPNAGKVGGQFAPVDDDGNVVPQNNVPSSATRKIRRAADSDKVGGQYAPVDDDGNVVPQNNVPLGDSDDSPNAGKVGGQFAPLPVDNSTDASTDSDNSPNAGKVGGQFAPLPVDNSTDASTDSDASPNAGKVGGQFAPLPVDNSTDASTDSNAGKVGGQFAPVDDDGNTVPQNNVPSDDSGDCTQ